jgi:hypothetical protein
VSATGTLEGLKSLPSEDRFATYTSPNKNGHPKATKKIAILGRAPSSLGLAPYDDPEWDIWTLGNAAQKMDEQSGQQKGVVNLPRWNRLFELHNLDEKKGTWPDDYYNWLGGDHGKPVVISAPHPDCPHGIVYPWQEVFDKFGTYLNNSVSEMIAMALLEGATHLGLYGIDMAQTDTALHNGNPEYQHQRPSCEYMVGIAKGMGVDVFIPDTSDLLKCSRVYGLQWDNGKNLQKFIARTKELNGRLVEMREKHGFHAEQWRAWEKIAAKLEGHLECIPEGHEARPAKQKEFDNAVAQVRNHKHMAKQFELNVAKFEGAIEDNSYHQQRM